MGKLVKKILTTFKTISKVKNFLHEHLLQLSQLETKLKNKDYDTTIKQIMKSENSFKTFQDIQNKRKQPTRQIIDHLIYDSNYTTKNTHK